MYIIIIKLAKIIVSTCWKLLGSVVKVNCARLKVKCRNLNCRIGHVERLRCTCVMLVGALDVSWQLRTSDRCCFCNCLHPLCCDVLLFPSLVALPLQHCTAWLLLWHENLGFLLLYKAEKLYPPVYCGQEAEWRTSIKT